MPFTEEIIKRGWKRSGGYCECTRTRHSHGGMCHKPLTDNLRGNKESPFGWEAYSVSGQYKNLGSDCEILCTDCYKAIH